MTKLIVLLLAVGLLVAGVTAYFLRTQGDPGGVRSAASPTTGASHPRPSFGTAEGWYVRESLPVPADQQLTWTPVAWAATAPLPAKVFHEPMPGWGTQEVRTFLAGLPADGIAILAMTSGSLERLSSSPGYPRRALPLRLDEADVRVRYEGQPASTVPLYLIKALVRGKQVEVRVYFGRLQPSPQQRAQAQEELATLRIVS